MTLAFRTFFCGVFIWLLCSGSAIAYDDRTDNRRIHLVGHIGVSSGGDDLATVYYTNGDSNKIYAGGLLHVSGGILVKTAPELSGNLETQITFGYKFDTSSAENGDLTFRRFPVDIIQFYRYKKIRFGAGITYHLNPELDGSDFFSDVHLEMDNALGGIAEIDYLFGARGFIGIQTTFIDYTFDSMTVDGNSIGIVLGAVF